MKRRPSKTAINAARKSDNSKKAMPWRSRLRQGLGVAALLSWCVLAPQEADAGKVVAVDGFQRAEVEIDLYIGFAATQDDLERAEEQFKRASEILCDATEGGVKITRVRVGDSLMMLDQADVIWQPDGVADTSFGSPGTAFGKNLTWIHGGNGTHATAEKNGGILGLVLAHELGHSLLGLYDSYESQRRWGKGFGMGPGLDKTEMDDITTLMSGAGRQECHDSLGVPIGEKQCFRAEDCDVMASETCPRTPAFSTELLTAQDFDTDAGSGSYPGIRPADRFWAVGWLSSDAPDGSILDWSAFVNWSQANTNTDVADEPRELVDDVGKLDGFFVVDDGASSHEIHLYFVHESGGPDLDLWRLYALIDGGELSGGTPGKPTVLEWDVGGLTYDWLSLEFDMTGTPDYQSADDPNKILGDNGTRYSADCYNLSEAHAQPFSGGVSTGDPVLLHVPAFSNGASAMDLDFEANPNAAGLYNGFMSCEIPGGFPSGVEPEINGDLRTHRFNGNTGARFDASGDRQTGDCSPGTTCAENGWLALWHDVNDRFEGANQRRQVSEMVERFQNAADANNNGIPDGEEEEGWALRDLIMNTGTGTPFDGADWDLLDFRFQARFGISLPDKPTGTNRPDPDVSAYSFCSDAYSGLDFNTDELQVADTVVYLLDSSVSMLQNENSGKQNLRRIEWAQAGASNAAQLALGSGQRIGLWTFDGPRLKRFPTGQPGDAGQELTQQADVDELEDVVQNIVNLGDQTRVGNALTTLGDYIDNDDATGNGEAGLSHVVIFSDGEQNPRPGHPWYVEPIISCLDGVDHLGDLGIKLTAVPIGGITNPGCLDLSAERTGGEMLPSAPRSLPHTMLEIYAKSMAQSLYDHPWDSSVAWNLQGQPTQESFPIEVEADAQGLNVLLTNMMGDLDSWTVDFDLYGPNSEHITKATQGAWTLEDELHTGLIQVNAPSEGVWSLVLSAVDPQGIPETEAQSQMVSVYLDHSGPGCDATVSRPVVTDDTEGVTIHAIASLDRFTVADGVNYTAVVERPDGSEVTVPMVPDADGQGHHGLFSEYRGSGYYKVAVTCDVGTGAYLHGGERFEAEDDVPGTQPTVPPFQRAASTAFYGDTGEWYFDDYASDCDGDGFSNGDEGVGQLGNVPLASLDDTDGDGIPDACDEDSDADGYPDSMEADDDTDSDGIDDRLDVDADDDGDIDGADLDPLDPVAHRYITIGDFDGDGLPDRAVGDQAYSSWRGRVLVEYGDPDVSSEYWEGVSSGDYYGGALTAGDIDGDGYDELIVGAPGDDVGGTINAGSLQVLYGSSTGLTTTGTQILHQDSSGIQGVVEAYDYFADRLVVGDFDGDGYGDLSVGVPREAIGSNSDAGVVHIIYGAAGGLSTVDDMYYQGNGGVNGSAESFDRFGDELAVGNFDADAFADLAVGIPREHIGSVSDAGMVYVMYGAATGLETTGDFSYSQNTSGAAGTSQANDYLGERLWVNDRDGDGDDDLTALVRGDGCGAGTKGFQVTMSAGGLSLSGNVVDCLDSYQSGFQP